MQRLDKGRIDEFFELLDKEIKNDLEAPSIKFTLIAVGGTSLVLRNLKISTKDFDFMVKDIDIKKLKAYLNRLPERLKVDVWPFPYVFSTTLPSDTDSDIYKEKYKNFDVEIINLLDNAVTKLSRLNEPDKEDIEIIISHGVSPKEIVERFNHILRNNGFPNKQDAENNLKIFEALYLEYS